MSVFIHILFNLICIPIRSRSWHNGRVKLNISKQQFIGNNDVHSELLPSIFKLRVFRDVSYSLKGISLRKYISEIKTIRLRTIKQFNLI